MNIDMMHRIASKSNHKYRHCSIIFAGNRLLTWGYNHGDVHSEIMALKRLDQLFRNDNTRKPKNLHIVNFMYKNASGNPGNSAPCENCASRIFYAGIKRVTYYNKGFKQMRFWNAHT